MLGSKNDFFKKLSKKGFELTLKHIEQLLLYKNRSRKDIARYVTAFRYFFKNTSQFDGATLVQDLPDIILNEEELDLDAMLHDYETIKGDNLSIIRNLKGNYRYIKNMQYNGKGRRWMRFILLTIACPFYVCWSNYKKYKNIL